MPVVAGRLDQYFFKFVKKPILKNGFGIRWKISLEKIYFGNGCVCVGGGGGLARM